MIITYIHGKMSLNFQCQIFKIKYIIGKHEALTTKPPTHVNINRELIKLFGNMK